MAQQVTDKYAPLVKASETETIPAAIVGAQTRDGKDELIVGSGNMVWDADSSLWLPVSQSNPLEARVRHLEALVGALNATKETNPDAASATLLALLRGLMATGATESTLGSVKTAAEALAGTVDSGALKTTLTGRTIALVPAPQGEIYVDDFSSAPSLTELSGQWSYNGSAGRVEETGAGGLAYFNSVPSLADFDMVLESQALASVNHYATPAWRIVDAENFYYIHPLFLRKMVEGQNHNIATGNFGLDPNERNTFRVRMVGDHIQVWVNDQLWADAFDDTFSDGRVGMRAHNLTGSHNIRFYSVGVYEPGNVLEAELPPSLLRWTLYVASEDTSDTIRVRVSPDGDGWWDISDGALELNLSGGAVVEMGYDAHSVQVIHSNPDNNVAAFVRGVG